MGCCRAWWVSLGSRDHSRTTESILHCPARSSFSIFLHNYLKVNSVEYWRALPTALVNHKIYAVPVLLVHNQQHAQHTTNHTCICTVALRTFYGSYGYWKCKTGSVCSILWSPGDESQDASFLWDQQHFLWDSVVDIMTESGESTKSSILKPSWQTLLGVFFTEAHQTKHTWWSFNIPVVGYKLK